MERRVLKRSFKETIDMKRIALAAVLGITALLAGCNAATQDDVGEGAGASSGTTRCGPPRSGLPEQSRCIDIPQLADAKTIVAVVQEGNRWTFNLNVEYGQDKVGFLYSDGSYATRTAAEEGVSALLRAALNPKAIEIDPIDREHDALSIKARNGKVLALSTSFKRHERAALVAAVQRALSSSDVSLLSENYRARWALDTDARTVTLVAGNGQRMLETAHIEPSASVDDAIFFLHETVASNYAEAQRAEAAELCWQVGVVDPATGEERPVQITKNLFLGQQRDGSFSVIVNDGDRHLATSTRGASDCAGGIEAAKRLTAMLSSMPRG